MITWQNVTSKKCEREAGFYLTQGTKVMKYFEILDDGIALCRAMATKRVNTLIKVLEWYATNVKKSLE